MSSDLLTLRVALERVRREVEDPVVTAFLKAALRELLLKIETHPDHILTDDEFCLFSFNRGGYEDHQVAAIRATIARYWNSKSSDSRMAGDGSS
ncbi:MAG: hypothetical protein M1813_002296 [Trichoglossum hirsutum]|jgi:hypothetical protein|nr:MAG: hypothetical protein M1813_002296 [Trichoglossum hirsutum]